MTLIIQFPNRSASPLDSALANLQTTFGKAGLSPDQMANATAELRRILEPLFEVKTFAVEIADDIDLSPSQLECVESGVREAFGRITTAHSKGVGYAAAVIADLVARQHLESK